MSEFAVGKTYTSWNSNYFGKTTTILVVDINESRTRLLAIRPDSENPLRADTFEITYDSRFGEKIRKGARGNQGTQVWRADKPTGDMAIPTGWYDGVKRDRQEYDKKRLKRACKPKANKMVLNHIVTGITKRHFAMAFNACLQNVDPTRADITDRLLAFWKEHNAEPLAISAICKDLNGWHITVSVTCEYNGGLKRWTLNIYAGGVMDAKQNWIPQEKYDAIFGGISTMWK